MTSERSARALQVVKEMNQSSRKTVKPIIARGQDLGGKEDVTLRGVSIEDLNTLDEATGKPVMNRVQKDDFALIQSRRTQPKPAIIKEAIWIASKRDVDLRVMYLLHRNDVDSIRATHRIRHVVVTDEAVMVPARKVIHPCQVWFLPREQLPVTMLGPAGQKHERPRPGFLCWKLYNTQQKTMTSFRKLAADTPMHAEVVRLVQKTNRLLRELEEEEGVPPAKRTGPLKGIFSEPSNVPGVPLSQAQKAKLQNMKSEAGVNGGKTSIVTGSALVPPGVSKSSMGTSDAKSGSNAPLLPPGATAVLDKASDQGGKKELPLEAESACDHIAMVLELGAVSDSAWGNMKKHIEVLLQSAGSTAQAVSKPKKELVMRLKTKFLLSARKSVQLPPLTKIERLAKAVATADQDVMAKLTEQGMHRVLGAWLCVLPPAAGPAAKVAILRALRNAPFSEDTLLWMVRWGIFTFVNDLSQSALGSVKDRAAALKVYWQDEHEKLPSGSAQELPIDNEVDEAAIGQALTSVSAAGQPAESARESAPAETESDSESDSDPTIAVRLERRKNLGNRAADGVVDKQEKEQKNGRAELADTAEEGTYNAEPGVDEQAGSRKVAPPQQPSTTPTQAGSISSQDFPQSSTAGGSRRGPPLSNKSHRTREINELHKNSPGKLPAAQQSGSGEIRSHPVPSQEHEVPSIVTARGESLPADATGAKNKKEQQEAARPSSAAGHSEPLMPATGKRKAQSGQPTESAAATGRERPRPVAAKMSTAMASQGKVPGKSTSAAEALVNNKRHARSGQPSSSTAAVADMEPLAEAETAAEADAPLPNKAAEALKDASADLTINKEKGAEEERGLDTTGGASKRQRTEASTSMAYNEVGGEAASASAADFPAAEETTTKELDTSNKVSPWSDEQMRSLILRLTKAEMNRVDALSSKEGGKGKTAYNQYIAKLMAKYGLVTSTYSHRGASGAKRAGPSAGIKVETDAASGPAKKKVRTKAKQCLPGKPMLGSNKASDEGDDPEEAASPQQASAQPAQVLQRASDAKGGLTLQGKDPDVSLRKQQPSKQTRRGAGVRKQQTTPPPSGPNAKAAMKAKDHTSSHPVIVLSDSSDKEAVVPGRAGRQTKGSIEDEVQAGEAVDAPNADAPTRLAEPAGGVTARPGTGPPALINIYIGEGKRRKEAKFDHISHKVVTEHGVLDPQVFSDLAKRTSSWEETIMVKGDEQQRAIGEWLRDRCLVCDSPLDGPNLLLCSNTDCERMYHLYCLTPPMKEIPVGDWFCPYCVAEEKDCTP